MRYVHTNIISDDWKSLARFYETVFQCVPVPPIRSQAGEWLAAGTGVPKAALEGVHLRLPGHGEDGPTLEIYQYRRMEKRPSPRPNRRGLGHLAFEVDDVAATASAVLAHGGRELGRVTRTRVEGVGTLTFVYLTDPEGNILEIQQWEAE